MRWDSQGILDKNYEFGDRVQFKAISEHSRGLANLIGGVDRLSRLRLSWSLDLSDFPKSGLDDSDELVDNITDLEPSSKSPLTPLDKEYLQLQRLTYRWRQDFDQERDLHMIECMASVLDLKLPSAVTQDGLADFTAALEGFLNYDRPFDQNHAQERGERYFQPVLAKARREGREQGSEEGTCQQDPQVPGNGGCQQRIGEDITSQHVAKDIPSQDDTGNDILTRVQAMDIDNEKLVSLKTNSEELLMWGPEPLIQIAELEKEQTDRRLTVWKESSSADGFAEAVFADARPATSLARLGEVPGVSLLRCHTQWLSELTELAQSNLQSTCLSLTLLRSDDCRRDSFTVELPSAGAHQIDIRVIKPTGEISRYELRKVWATLVNRSDAAA
ncbi:hypothetical protein DFH09DRAFT_1071506 [Mycena vulgaris]|nr:hypothetical protein DFH09DRAFT_1071506 [Mycena vulgaris]